jgi:hypothetical protein
MRFGQAPREAGRPEPATIPRPVNPTFPQRNPLARSKTPKPFRTQSRTLPTFLSSLFYHFPLVNVNSPLDLQLQLNQKVIHTTERNL